VILAYKVPRAKQVLEFKVKQVLEFKVKLDFKASQEHKDLLDLKESKV